jgi:hypothetical protein
LHCSECWHTSRKNVENNQNGSTERYVQSIAQTEKMAAIENVADPKIIAVPLVSLCSTCQREKV